MKLSVITPVYNREDCISRCIESVVRNLSNDNELEHVIVDDGSTDLTSSIILQYSKLYSHIRYIKLSENAGTNAARNRAIENATGDYCIILDSDDYFLDDAIAFIADTIKASFPHFTYFMFSPDDMMVRYDSNQKLSNYQNVLTYEDFLLGKVSGDFVHVIPAKIAKKNKFNEKIRIYEGVFFLRYYKEVMQMLFTKKVVTVRERNRSDSVSKLYIQTQDKYIQYSIGSKEIFVNWFAGDLIKLNAFRELSSTYITLMKDYMLLSDYCKAKEYKNLIVNMHYKLPVSYNILYYCHLGFLYKIICRGYLYIKYFILNHNL